jgi:hypothetical protein
MNIVEKAETFIKLNPPINREGLPYEAVSLISGLLNEIARLNEEGEKDRANDKAHQREATVCRDGLNRRKEKSWIACV